MNDNGYSISVFGPDVPANVKTRKIVFFIVMSLIILAQSAYWLFANSVKPIIFGLPFGMFFVVLLIGVEFLALLVFYLIEAKEFEE